MCNPGNTHEKKFGITKYPREKKCWTYEIPTIKNFGPAKSQWHDGTRLTRTTMARDPRNLAHSKLKYEILRISAT